MSKVIWWPRFSSWQRIFSSPLLCPNRLWNPPSLLFNGLWRIYPRWQGSYCENFTAHLRLGLRLKTSEVFTCNFPYIVSWSLGKNTISWFFAMHCSINYAVQTNCSTHFHSHFCTFLFWLITVLTNWSFQWRRSVFSVRYELNYKYYLSELQASKC
jgi:hypothetical protein